MSKLGTAKFPYELNPSSELNPFRSDVGPRLASELMFRLRTNHGKRTTTLQRIKVLLMLLIDSVLLQVMNAYPYRWLQALYLKINLH